MSKDKKSEELPDYSKERNKKCAENRERIKATSTEPVIAVNYDREARLAKIEKIKEEMPPIERVECKIKFAELSSKRRWE
jgi:hypothetical protein